MKIKELLVTVVLSVTAIYGCQPQEPVKCVCNCEGPIPEGAVVRVEGGDKAAAKAAPAAKPAAAKPAARPTPAKPPAAKPAEGRKAAGKVSAEPGSGTPVTVTADDKKEMAEVIKGFAEAAGKRSLPDMQKWTTERLGNSLVSAVEKHTDRLYRRTDIFSNGAKKGVEIGTTNDVGDGNYDVEIKFGDGENVRLLFFKELGKWRLNRL